MINMSDINYPNLNDYKEKFWNYNYRILYTRQGIKFYVNADCLQDAIDYMIDYIELKKWDGLLLYDSDILELEKEGFLDEYIHGGNHGRYLSSYNIHIEKEND